ncbi:MAG: hypothetical protein C0522_06200, partial [Rhodocyclaceae bacterium]|nr:hypothetical protein [Rhodocyclaceae bacterium]
ERLKRHLLRLEREIRTLAAAGMCGSLTKLWDAAAERIAPCLGQEAESELAAVRASLKVNGEVVDCGSALPPRLLAHAWRRVQEAKTRKLHARVGRMILKLSDILRADYVRSEAGRSAASLRAAVGGGHENVFDFDEMSRLLNRAAPKAWLSESRRRRIGYLLSVLESHRLFTLPSESDAQGTGPKAHSFVFVDCAAALKAYRERLPKLVDLAKAIAMSLLEIKGEYAEAKHDPFFEQFGEHMLSPGDLALFPDYLVCLNARDLKAIENAELADILSAGLPMKFLVQSDDILDSSPVGNGRLAFGVRMRQLTGMAMGQTNVYVMQASASHLYQVRKRILAGLSYPGPALFSIFSGATKQCGELPPYLVAAAAMESRAFPAFSYDPSAGRDWAQRFRLEDNPQQEADWPMHPFAYEDGAHQRVGERLPFTLVDFAACDRRYARYFAKLPLGAPDGGLMPMAESLHHEPSSLADKVPSLPMIDRNNRLRRVVVDDKLVREARRCGEAWHSLQELGGVHNSHAESLLASERRRWEEQQAPGAPPPTAAPEPVAETAAAPGGEIPPTAASDEPYIETPRCTTCNECTQINNKMFRYNADKQAYIAGPDAGTYRQLVEAAESCQVSIIHPGRPRNLHEPGLEELLERAEPFL